MSTSQISASAVRPAPGAENLFRGCRLNPSEPARNVARQYGVYSRRLRRGPVRSVCRALIRQA